MKTKTINAVLIVARPENRSNLPKTDVKLVPNHPTLSKIEHF
jgi:hypothetical protein